MSLLHLALFLVLLLVLTITSVLDARITVRGVIDGRPEVVNGKPTTQIDHWEEGNSVIRWMGTHMGMRLAITVYSVVSGLPIFLGLVRMPYGVAGLAFACVYSARHWYNWRNWQKLGF